jgi:hypothetical protein
VDIPIKLFIFMVLISVGPENERLAAGRIRAGLKTLTENANAIE